MVLAKYCKTFSVEKRLLNRHISELEEEHIEINHSC